MKDYVVGPVYVYTTRNRYVVVCSQNVIRHACYPDACSKRLIQTPDEEDQLGQEKETQPEKPKTVVDQPKEKADSLPEAKKEPRRRSLKAKDDEEKPTLKKPLDVVEPKKKEPETLTAVQQKESSPAEKAPQAKTNGITKQTTPAGKEAVVVQQPQATPEPKSVQPNLSTVAGKPQKAVLSSEKSKVPDQEPKSLKEEAKLQPVAEEVAPKAEAPTSSPKKVEPPRPAQKEPTETISQTKTVDDEVKKSKVGEKPPAPRQFNVPKVSEPQVQEKPHSTDGFGKPDTTSADVAKTLHNTKFALKPVKVGLKSTHKTSFGYSFTNFNQIMTCSAKSFQLRTAFLFIHTLSTKAHEIIYYFTAKPNALLVALSSTAC